MKEIKEIKNMNLPLCQTLLQMIYREEEKTTNNNKIETIAFNVIPGASQ